MIDAMIDGTMELPKGGYIKTGLIDIKNKQDMEGEKHSNLESTGKKLKEFNLEAAKAGKPVCTRDGRKARIICFDRKFYQNGYNYPIVAMVNDNDNELVHTYTQDGLLVGNAECELDLMMIPEKKERWVNVYRKEHNDYCKGIFQTKEEAVNAISEVGRKHIATVKIECEE